MREIRGREREKGTESKNDRLRGRGVVKKVGCKIKRRKKDSF
jgi:hypothetical protein